MTNTTPLTWTRHTTRGVWHLETPWADPAHYGCGHRFGTGAAATSTTPDRKCQGCDAVARLEERRAGR